MSRLQKNSSTAQDWHRLSPFGKKFDEVMNKTKRKTKGTRIGQCRLCLADNVELCDSHILPKFAYKRLRDPSVSNPNPVTVTTRQTVQASHQITEYMLCRDCEDLFQVPETYVASLAYTSDGDPLILNELGVVPTGWSLPSLTIPVGSLETDKLVYFAASVFWRASVATQDGFDKLELGPYREQLRQYLLGASGFPAGARLNLTVLDQSKSAGRDALHNVMTFPRSDNMHGEYRLHQFLMCGLNFMLVIGKKIPEIWSLRCLHHGTEKGIGLATGDKFGVLRWIAVEVPKAIPRGKLGLT